MNKFSSKTVDDLQKELSLKNTGFFEYESYVDLCLAIIKQAVDDLKYRNSKNSELRTYFKTAVNFLKESNPTFIIICNFLQTDPGFLLKSLKICK
jgi:hypothetical protein